jgi:hypothetical protein
MPRKKKAAAADAAPVEPAKETSPGTPDLRPESASPVGEESEASAKGWAAGPHWLQTVGMTADRDGPRMRVGENRRYRQMVVQFDVKPDEEHREALHAAGFRWRPAEEVWTRQIDPDRPRADRADAERLFDRIADDMRRENGVGRGVG